MKILLINHYAGSLDMGMEYRPFYMGREWSKNGHEVTILCASFAHVRKSQPEVKQDLQEEEVSGIRYVYLKTPRYEGNGIRRVVNIFVFVLKLLFYAGRIARRFRPDAVIASSTYPLDNYPAKRISRKSGGKYIYEVHDLWPLSPVELGGFSRNHPFIRIMQRAEDYACRNADLLISMLPLTLAHFREHGLEESKWQYVPNGVFADDPDHEIPPPPHLAEELKKDRSHGYNIIGYTGSIGLANALDNLLKAAEILKGENYRFYIIGDGPEKDRLLKEKARLGLANVAFFDPIPKNSLPVVFRYMDALYIGLQRVSLFRFGVSPNKLLDYMVAGKPVIHAIDAGNDLVADSNCGVSVEPENPEALAAGIRRLFELDPGSREKLGANGKDYVLQHHEYGRLAGNMLSLMKK